MFTLMTMGDLLCWIPLFMGESVLQPNYITNIFKYSILLIDYYTYIYICINKLNKRDLNMATWVSTARTLCGYK